MSPSGLQAVSNASEMFLTEQCLDSEVVTGLAVAAVMDGARTFLIIIQVNFFSPFNSSILLGFEPTTGSLLFFQQFYLSETSPSYATNYGYAALSKSFNNFHLLINTLNAVSGDEG